MNNCFNCDKEVNEDFNFCPYCDAPLNDIAKKLKDKQNCIAQIKLINNLIDKVSDANTLQLLEALLDEYRKNV